MRYVSAANLCAENHLSLKKISEVARMLKRKGVKNTPFRKFGKFAASEARAEMPSIVEAFRKKSPHPGKVGIPHPTPRGQGKVMNGLDKPKKEPAQLDLFAPTDPPSTVLSISERLLRLEKKVDTLIALWS